MFTCQRHINQITEEFLIKLGGKRKQKKQSKQERILEDEELIDYGQY